MTPTTPETACTGRVLRMVTLTDVATDSAPWRRVTVDITRCTSCPGTAFVTDEDGRRWKLDLPSDYKADDEWAAYWAAEVSSWRRPFYEPPLPEPEPEPELTDEDLEAMAEAAEADYLADLDSERAYAEMLERRAERGTWFGREEVW